jgi:hypothetical protein
MFRKRVYWVLVVTAVAGLATLSLAGPDETPSPTHVPKKPAPVTGVQKRPPAAKPPQKPGVSEQVHPAPRPPVGNRPPASGRVIPPARGSGGKKVPSTHLQVEVLGGELEQWSSLKWLEMPQSVRFRWATDAKATSGLWQLSDKPFSTGAPLQAPVLAKGAVTLVPVKGQQSVFPIDLTKFLPKVATATTAKFYVRVIPMNGTQQAGPPSAAVNVNYGKSSSTTKFLPNMGPPYHFPTTDPRAGGSTDGPTGEAQQADGGIDATAYAIGVDMGFASYQSQRGSSSGEVQTFTLTLEALEEVLTGITGMNILPDEVTAALQALIDGLNAASPLLNTASNLGLNVVQDALNTAYPGIVKLREDVLKPAFNAVPGQAGQAYTLGICIGIAEAGATSPDDQAARKAVIDSLNTARPFAVSLNLPTDKIDKIIGDLNNHVAMPDVHQELTELREFYQDQVP